MPVKSSSMTSNAILRATSSQTVMLRLVIAVIFLITLKEAAFLIFSEVTRHTPNQEAKIKQSATIIKTALLENAIYYDLDEESNGEITAQLKLIAEQYYVFRLNTNRLNINTYPYYVIPEVLPGPAAVWIDWLMCPCFEVLTPNQTLEFIFYVQAGLPQNLDTVQFNFPLLRLSKENSNTKV